jgi:hypothetical protein
MDDTTSVAVLADALTKLRCTCPPGYCAARDLLGQGLVSTELGTIEEFTGRMRIWQHGERLVLGQGKHPMTEKKTFMYVACSGTAEE